LDLAVDILKLAITGICIWIGNYIRKNAIPITKQLVVIYKIVTRVDTLESQMFIHANRHEAWMDVSVSPIFIMDNKGNMIYANAAWGELTGFDNIEDAYAMGWVEAIQEEHMERIERINERLVEHPSSWDGEVPMKNKKTNARFIVRCRTQLLKDKSGNITGALGRLNVI